MVLFSCTSYTANKYSNKYLPDRGDIVSAIGAVVIGSLGNIYSRLVGGVAFTSMVTGVLFLVPVSTWYPTKTRFVFDLFLPSLESPRQEAYHKPSSLLPINIRQVLVWLFG